MSNAFKIFLFGCAVIVGVAIFAVMRLDNARLRKGIAEARRQSEETARLRAENARLQTVLARAAADRGEADRAMRAELETASREVAALENRAATKLATDATSLANQTDPEKGLVRLENYQNAGQDAPARAFQTFVWAVMKGEDERLSQLIAFSAKAREKARLVVAAMPEPDRAKYATPEKLAALFFADALTTMPAAEIVGVTMTDARHAVIRVRGLTPKEQKIPLQQGAHGWQISVPEQMVAKLEGWARGRQ